MCSLSRRTGPLSSRDAKWGPDVRGSVYRIAIFFWNLRIDGVVRWPEEPQAGVRFSEIPH